MFEVIALLPPIILLGPLLGYWGWMQSGVVRRILTFAIGSGSHFFYAFLLEMIAFFVDGEWYGWTYYHAAALELAPVMIVLTGLACWRGHLASRQYR
jgi:hypothetical protein